MMDYWELSERKRAALTEEEVKRFSNYELMRQGILRPSPPPKIPDFTVVDVPMEDRFAVGDVLFRTQEEALAFLALNPEKRDYDHRMGYSYQYYAKPLAEAIQRVSVYNAESLLAKKAELAEINAKQEEIERQREAYDKASKAVAKATGELWQDYWGCVALARRHKKVIDTLQDYIKMTNGDEEIARTFLEKAFSEQDIKEAEEWFKPENESE